MNSNHKPVIFTVNILQIVYSYACSLMTGDVDTIEVLHKVWSNLSNFPAWGDHMGYLDNTERALAVIK